MMDPTRFERLTRNTDLHGDPSISRNFPPDKWPCPDLHILEKFLSKHPGEPASVRVRLGQAILSVRPATGLFSKMIQTCPTWQQTFIHCMLPLSFLTFLFELGSNMGDGIDCVDIWTSYRGGIRILISRGGFREKIIINQKKSFPTATVSLGKFNFYLKEFRGLISSICSYSEIQ